MLTARGQERPVLILPKGHSGAIKVLAFNPRQTKLYSVGVDGLLKSWDVSSGKEIQSLQIFDGNFKSIEDARMDISPSGQLAVVNKRLLGYSWLIDLNNFQVIQKISSLHSGITGILFSADSKGLYIGGMNGLEETDLTGKIKNTWFGNTVAKISAGAPFIQAMAISPDRSLIALGFGLLGGPHSGGCSVQILQTNTGAIIHQFPLDVGAMANLCFSSNGNRLLFSDSRQAYLFELTGKRLRKIPVLSGGIATFNEKDRELVFFGHSGMISRFRESDLTKMGGYYPSNSDNSNITAVIYHHASGLFFRASTTRNQDDSQTVGLESFDTKEERVVMTLNVKSSVVRTAAFDPEGSLLLTGSGDGLARFWDLAVGGVVRRVQSSPNKDFFRNAPEIRQVLFAPDGNAFVINSSVGVRAYSLLGKDSLLISYELADRVNFLSSGNTLAVANKRSLKTFALRSDSVLKKIKLDDIPIDKGIVGIAQNDVGCLLLSSKAEAYLLDSTGRKTVFRPQFQGLSAGAVVPGATIAIFGGGFTEGEFTVADQQTGKVIYQSNLHNLPVTDVRVAQKSRIVAATSADRTASLWDLTNPESPALLFRLRGHSDAILSCAFSADDRLLVTNSEDRTSKIWSTATGKELVTLITVGQEWLMVTPEGYYFASPKGARLVHFVRKRKVYYFDQYDLLFNRPDIVLEKLGLAPVELIDRYRKASELRRKRMQLKSAIASPDFYDAPELRVIGAENFPLVSSQSKFTFKISAIGSSHISRLQIKVNGVPVYGIAGKAVAGTSLKLLETLSVELAPGRNQIEVSVMDNRDVWSNDERIEIFGQMHEKPALYVVSLGVSNYADKRMNLRYAAKDAEDLARHFKDVASNYSSVHCFTLTDAQMIVAKFRALKDSLKISRPGDQVILFYAGHGQRAGDYYITPYDQDFDHPEETGISYTALEELIDGIPARKKIILIDACGSGDFDTKETRPAVGLFIPGKPLMIGGEAVASIFNDDSFELMKHIFNDLRISSGATVVASASSKEIAWEDEKYKNGFFTYALLRGLDTGEADLDKNGKTTVSELLQHVQQQVSALSDGKQRPEFRMENLVEDFQVY